MSWAQVECVKCGKPMGDHAGLFVEGKPWHTACHYNVLTARLAKAEALIQPRMSLHAEIARLQKLLDEHSETIKRYREKYEQEKEDRQKAEARQYSVGAEHLREYAARVKERDEARQTSETHRTEYMCMFITNPCGHLERFREDGVGCVKCANEKLLVQLRHFIPEPGICEHGIEDGVYCEPCNKAYKEAANEAAKGE